MLSIVYENYYCLGVNKIDEIFYFHLIYLSTYNQKNYFITLGFMLQKNNFT